MDLTFHTAYKKFGDIFHNGIINLDGVNFFSPWGMGLVCLKAIENMNKEDKNLILPNNIETLSYIKRVHFDKFMSEISYNSFLTGLDNIKINERENLNIHEIMHCSFRDEFAARLQSKIRAMFLSFGLNNNDEQKITGLVAELGNNVFDHNAGSWSTNIVGAIIIAQNYPKLKKIEVIVADPGVGFLGSLKVARPELKNNIDAIKIGLTGVTGRVGEKRGNGLITIQDWTINQLSGIVRIHSGNGLVVIDKNGQKEQVVSGILGTLAGLEIVYN